MLHFKNDENLEKTLIRGYHVDIIFMDLTKAFGNINDSPLLSKLLAFGFPVSHLKLLQSYLCNRFQINKVNESFSRSFVSFILSLLLVNIYLKNIFFSLPRTIYVTMLMTNILYPISETL